MKKYTIKEASHITDIPVHTLRYYDKIGLVKANREENNYRYYNDEDILFLKYVQVMKYANFSLEEISMLITSGKNIDVTCQDSKEVLNYLKQKHNQILSKIKHLNKVAVLIVEVEKMIATSDTSSICKIDELVISIFENREEVF